jgi:hypothetical protein
LKLIQEGIEMSIEFQKALLDEGDIFIFDDLNA